MHKVGVILRVKLAVSPFANFAYRLFGAGGISARASHCFNTLAAVYGTFTAMRAVAVGFPIAKSMPVVDRYGHLVNIARLVGDNDFLLAVCRSESKAAAFIKPDLRAVYGDGIHICLVNGDRLRLAVGLSVLNAADDRLNIVKRYAVGAKVCYVQALINEHCINNIFSVGVYAERLLVRTVHKRAQLRLGEIPIGHQIGDKHGSAVVGSIYRHLLRILKEQAESELV